MDLCAEVESARIIGAELGGVVVAENDSLVYEFAALNFLSEPMPLAFHSIKNLAASNIHNPHQTSDYKSHFDSRRDSNFSKKPKSSLIVFNGFQIKCSSYHLDKGPKNANTNLSASTNNLMNASMTSSSMSSSHSMTCMTPGLLASLFFRVQVNLRNLTTNVNYLDMDDSISPGGIDLNIRNVSAREKPAYPPKVSIQEFLT